MQVRTFDGSGVSVGARSWLRVWLAALVAVVTAVAVVGVAPSRALAFAGGDGSANNPFLVATAGDLDQVRDNPSVHYRLVADIDLTGYLAPGGPGYNDGAGWAPIGDFGSSFTGSFDGNGHKITGLWINRPSTNAVGLFGVTGSAATISNLGVEAAAAGVTGHASVGGLLGRNDGGTLTNCYATGNVKGYFLNVGGLAGDNLSGSIRDCYATGDVTGDEAVGGLVGFNYSGGTIKNCYAIGKVSGSSRVGGLAGDNLGSLSGCFFDTETTGTDTGVGAGDAGGVTGKTTAEMKTKSTFTDAGWDFDTVWAISPDVNNGYPYLQVFAAEVSSAGGLVPITPTRLMDTRRGLGATGPVGADATIHLPVLGHGGVPAEGVKAVVLNVTATAPTATSFVTVWAGGEPRPGTSNLNVTAGQTVANAVVVPVGADGTVDFYNRAGTVQLVADVSGWFTAGSQLAPGGLGTVRPDRLMDTRTGLGTAGPVGPGETVHLPVLGHGGVPGQGVGAVVLTVTVTRPTAAHSFVTVWPDGRPRPGTSNLNFTAGQTRANLVIAPVGANGDVNFFNAAGNVDVVADVSGWFAAGAPAPGGLGPLEPTRILDTRIPGVGGFIGPVPAGGTVHLPVLGHGGVPASGVEAVVLNVTATEPTATGFVTVWADGQGRPGTSNLNFTAGQTVANAVIAPVGKDGNVDFFNSNGNTQLVADVSGWFASPANGNRPP